MAVRASYNEQLFETISIRSNLILEYALSIRGVERTYPPWWTYVRSGQWLRWHAGRLEPSGFCTTHPSVVLQRVLYYYGTRSTPSPVLTSTQVDSAQVESIMAFHRSARQSLIHLIGSTQRILEMNWLDDLLMQITYPEYYQITAK